MLDIKPSFLPEAGDCFGAIICKLFEYYKLDDYAIIYRHSGQFYFQENNLRNEYDINKCISFGYQNYDETLYKYFGIKSIHVTHPSIDNVIFLLNKKIPIILYTYNMLCPWRKSTEYAPHYCLIVGYDLEKLHFYSLDPVFTDKIEIYPFCNLSNRDILISYYDITDVSKHTNIPDFLVPNFFACLNEKMSWENIEQMKNRMEISITTNEISRSNVFLHCLNARSWFFIKARLLQIKSYFTLLEKKYKSKGFSNILNVFSKYYSNIDKAWMLILKYKETGDYDILRRFLHIFEQCIYLEKEAGYILEDKILDISSMRLEYQYRH